jgi:hypothetical protein
VNEKTTVRAFPAPEQLAMPTDLAWEDVQKLTEAVNPIIIVGSPLEYPQRETLPGEES